MTADFLAFAGDWHGDTQWGLKVIRHLHEWNTTTLIHLGDFGIWPGPSGQRYLDILNTALNEVNARLLVVPGNHEDYNQITALTPNEDGLLPIRDSILLFPRGYVFTYSGFSFLALGGAVSIDRNLRKLGESWWIDESFNDDDIATAKKAVDDHGHPDFMLTHEAPAGVNFGYTSHGRPAWFTPEIEYEAHSSRRTLRDLVDYATPTYLIHGHHHRTHGTVIDGIGYSDQSYETRVLGLANERLPGNVVVVKLDREGDQPVRGRFPFGAVKKEVMKTFNSIPPFTLRDADPTTSS